MAVMLGAAPEELDALGAVFDTQANALREIVSRVTGQVARTTWVGPDLDAFAGQWQQRHALDLTRAGQLLAATATELRSQAAQQRAASESIAGPGSVGGAGSAPGPNPVDVVLGVVGAALPGRSDRNPDGRDGRRIRNDQVIPGDRSGGGSFSNDWAGRAILERYLAGGNDWTLANDPNWRAYMEANGYLSNDLAGRNEATAGSALAAFLAGGPAAGQFDARFHETIQNGEGIVGYQYLHGTDNTAGDFHYAGSTTVVALPDGTYRVDLTVNYEWNDTIDPNPEYSTDKVKNWFAEVITLGQADPYQIHIQWTDTTSVIMAADGTAISASGYAP